MRRRDVVKLLAGAAIAAPYRVAAQTSAKTYRLATLSGGAAITADSPMGKILTGALAEHGYTLGRSLEIQAYGANMQPARLPQLARDIAASMVDAVVVIGWPPTAAMKGTGVPTVVVIGAGDPVFPNVAAGRVAATFHQAQESHGAALILSFAKRPEGRRWIPPSGDRFPVFRQAG